MFGLFQVDGHLSKDTRNRGKFSIEMKSSDSMILLELQEHIPYHSKISYRERTTNFGHINTAILQIYSREFRDEINMLGIPYGKKSSIIAPPNTEYSIIDYYRGVVDANGSLGITSKNIPFVSLNIYSDALKDSYLNMLTSITKKHKTASRTLRDNTYNIVVYKEDAQKLVHSLYYPGCICIRRKYNFAVDVMNWTRPIDMKVRSW